MDEDYILVAEDANDHPVELPLEEDGTILLTTVDAQFPGTSGLKFTNPKTGASRGIRLSGDKLHPPEKNGWGDRVYLCVFPKDGKKETTEAPPAQEIKEEPESPSKAKSETTTTSNPPSGKRKAEDDNGPTNNKVPKVMPKCTDLMIRGLAWETTEESLSNFFEKKLGGTVALAQVKKNSEGRSRGFGFVRFTEYEHQRMALKTGKYEIDGRWCEVSISPSALDAVNKIFVGRLSNDIGARDLKKYFSVYGDVTDCFIPKPFRNFGYITFLDPEVVKAVCQTTHEVKGTKINVEAATPKQNDYGNGGQNGNFRGGNVGGNRGNNSRDWRYSGGRGSDGPNRDSGRDWNNQGMSDNRGGGRRGDWQDEDNYGSNRGKFDLSNVNPALLISALKTSGIADALVSAADTRQDWKGLDNCSHPDSQRGGGGHSRNGGQQMDDPYGRSSYRQDSSRGYDNQQTSQSSSWSAGYNRRER